MRKKIIIMYLLGLMLLPLNTYAENKKKTVNKNRIIIRISKSYNKSLQGKIDGILGTKVKSYKKIAALKNNNVYVVYTKNNITDFNKKIAKIDNIKEVNRVHVSYKYKVDPITSRKSTRAVGDNWHVSKVNADKMKDAVTSTEKVKVGVLDTGVDTTHKGLKDNLDLENAYNSIDKSKDARDDNGHGTHVSGLVGANNKYAVGKNITVVPMKVLTQGWGSTEDIAAAIDYARNKDIKVLNMSLGVEYFDELIFESILNYKGLVVAAAGNENTNETSYPAGYELDNIISVASSDKSDVRSDFSNYSSTAVDIFAPGEDIYSTCKLSYSSCSGLGSANYDEEDQVGAMSGTSMASPVVAGVAGTILSDNPNLTTQELKNSIINSAKKVKALNKKVTTGGYVDAMKALELARGKEYQASHSAKLENGLIKLWGDNASGQLGNGNTNNVTESNAFTPTNLDGKVVKYYLTTTNTYLVTDKGNLYVSGKNDFNQLGQGNKVDSNTFVKFKKKSESHFITTLSFVNKLGLYDESSLKINLKDTGEISHYYKLGSNSFKLESESRVFSDKLQYVTLRGQRILSLQLSEGVQVDKYIQPDNYYPINEIVNRKITTNTSTDKTIKILEFSDGKSKMTLTPTKVTTTKYNKVNVVLSKKSISYNNYYSIDYLSGDSFDTDGHSSTIVKQIKDVEVDYKYTNNRHVQSTIKKYNSSGTLKATSSQKPYREVRKYNSGNKLVSINKAYYSTSGKLSKYKLTYKAVYKKKNTDIYKYQYNSGMSLIAKSKGIYYINKTPAKYYLTKYNKNKKVAYLDRTYKKGVRSLEKLYKYNNKGTLKSTKSSKAYLYIKYYKKGKLVKTERYTYNASGKKTNKKVTKTNGGKK